MPEGSVLLCVVAPVLLAPVLAPPDCGLLCCVAVPPPSRFMPPCALAAEAPAISAMPATETRKRIVISISSRVCIALADNEASYDTFLSRSQFHGVGLSSYGQKNAKRKVGTAVGGQEPPVLDGRARWGAKLGPVSCRRSQSRRCQPLI